MSAALRVQLLLAGLSLAVAAPAGAAETHPRDLPDSQTFVSPAQLYRFDQPALALDASYDTATERQRWSGGDVTDATSTPGARLVYVDKATPSLYWSLTASRSTTFESTGDTATLGDRRQTYDESASEFGPDAAYKILDSLVVGAGVHGRRAEINPGAGGRFALNYLTTSQGILLKSTWYEAGWAQTLYLVDDTGTEAKASAKHTERETFVHARYHPSATAAIGLIYRQNPFPTCCLAAATNASTYTLTLSSQLDALTLTGLLTYAPAYAEARYYDIAHSLLSVEAGYALDRLWALNLRVSYGYGQTKDAAVRLATPLGLTDTAAVLELQRGAALGLIRSL